MALLEDKLTDPTPESPEALIREARELQRRRRRRRGAAMVVGLLVLAGGGIVVAGGGGTPAGPAVGGPLPTGISARAADPAGGLGWGLRVVRTSGWTCAQLGRLRGDQLGMLGEDNAFGNDGRFHPFGPSATKQAYCAQNDGRGHAFLNIQLGAQPASGKGAGYRTVSGCRLASEVSSARQALSRNIVSSKLRSKASRFIESWNVCPAGDLRYIEYGLLGPEATSITYNLGGRDETARLHGPDGAYLVVAPSSPSTCARLDRHGPCGGVGWSSGPQIFGGLITAVHYRDGQTCRLNRDNPREPVELVRCPRAGYVPAKSPVSASQVAAPVSVHLIKAKHYCFTRNEPVIYESKAERLPAPATDIGPYLPCDGPVPANEVRDRARTHGTNIVFSWTARVPVTSASSRYEWSIKDPCGTGSGDWIIGHIHAGERLTRGIFEPRRCTGTATGSIYYDPNVGPNGISDRSIFRARLRGQRTDSLLVGQFSIRIR